MKEQMKAAYLALHARWWDCESWAEMASIKTLVNALWVFRRENGLL